jgi:hypothetical protein
MSSHLTASDSCSTLRLTQSIRRPITLMLNWKATP